MGSIIIILDNNNNPPPTHAGNISQEEERRATDQCARGGMGSIIIILDNNNNPPSTRVGNISQGGDRLLIMRPSHACRGGEEERYSTEEFNRRIQPKNSEEPQSVLEEEEEG